MPKLGKLPEMGNAIYCLLDANRVLLQLLAVAMHAAGKKSVVKLFSYGIRCKRFEHISLMFFLSAKRYLLEAWGGEIWYTMKKIFFLLLSLFFTNILYSQWENNSEIQKGYLKLVKKELKTEPDGFQWYLYSYRFTWDNKIDRYGATNKYGVALSRLHSSDVDWRNSGYISSHKVFVMGWNHSGGGLARGGFYGEVFTLDGKCIADIGGASNVEYKDHGIIIADEYSGVYYNNKVIIPFDGEFRNITYSDNRYIATKNDYEGNKTYYIYSDKGDLLGGKFIEKQIVAYDVFPMISKVLFYDGERTYDYNANFLFLGHWDNRFFYDGDKHTLYLCVKHKNLYGIRDLDGKEILPTKYNSINKCEKEGYQYIKVQGEDKKYGLYSIDGTEILAPEFEDCNLIGNNSIKFKMNGYWGVMSKEGKVYIPISRQYTKIEYNRTFKKFYFEKDGGYKGECNASGVQTSISKVQAPKPVASNTSSSSTSSSSSRTSSSTSVSSSSSSSSTSFQSEPGLLFKGPYTKNCNDVPMTITLSVYENRLFDGLISYSYQGTNSLGERIYTGSLWDSFTKWYVNTSNQNVRCEQTVSTQWGSSTVTCSVTKGHDFNQRATFGGNNGGGGYTPSSPSNTNSGTSTNPVQPHQVTKSCSSCLGSGKCSTCNGKHWYYGIGGAQITCPNCKPNGACSSCGGSGKVSSTKYY